MNEALDALARELVMVRSSIDLMKATEKRLGDAITLLKPSFPGWVDPTKKIKVPTLKPSTPVVKKAVPSKKPTPERSAVLQKVADVAVEAIGRGVDPDDAVAATFGWKRSTATTTIGEARKIGHPIPKKTTGRKAAAPAPTVPVHAE